MIHFHLFLGYFSFSPDISKDRSVQMNDIALIRLSHPVPLHRVIKMCENFAPFHTLLGTCGMGFTATTGDSSFGFSKVLVETHFFENKLSCRIDNICAKQIYSKSNICDGDYGSPLYTFRNYNLSDVDCLYGLASFARDRKTCSKGSFFTSIPYFRSFIRSTMMLYDQPE